MSSIMSSVVFIKSVSGESICTSVACSRTDNEEFAMINFKAFRTNREIMIQEIKVNSIMLIIGKFLNVGSESYL